MFVYFFVSSAPLSQQNRPVIPILQIKTPSLKVTRAPLWQLLFVAYKTSQMSLTEACVISYHLAPGVWGSSSNLNDLLPPENKDPCLMFLLTHRPGRVDAR